MRNVRCAAYPLWLAALLSCPAPATAASVAIDTNCGKYGCPETLVYSAVRGERNEVTASQEGDVVTIRDTAGIQPGAGCEALDPSTARCAFAQNPLQRGARLDLRDRDDDLDARELSIRPLLRGGAGADRLLGPQSAVFAGGPGDDSMVGGTGPDTFQSNRRDGADTMAGGPPPPPLLQSPSLSLLEFSTPYDEVFYGRRTASIRVEPDGRPNDGGRREHDNLVSIEQVWAGGGDDVLIGGPADEYMYGGAGSDVLRGGAGGDILDGGDRIVPDSDLGLGTPDRLEGGAGPDTLDGKGGRDLILGGPGRDQLDGGRGADRMRSGDPDRDWVLCGGGLDRLAASAADVVMRGCERRPGATGVAEGIVNWRWAPVAVILLVGCPVAAPEDCAGTLSLAIGGNVVGTAPYSARPGRVVVVDLPLNAADFDVQQLSTAVASTAGDSARVGELPWWFSDSVRVALGVPGL